MDDLRYQIDLLTALNRRLTNNEKMYKMICETSNSAFLYFNLENGMIKTLGKWDSFFDFRLSELSDINRIIESVEDRFKDGLRTVFYLEKENKKVASVECRLKDEKTWLEFENTVCYNEDSVPTDKVIRIKNITKFKSQNDELIYLAYYDILTGLYNRNYFARLLSDYVHRAEKEKSIISVMFIDIDDFHKINDGMGLVMGDEVVQNLGQYLHEFMDDNVIVSHFNSDIYCMAIYDPCGYRSVDTIYKNIQERLKKPLRLTNGSEIALSVSVGVAEYPEASQSALELINCAEIVMFKAKAAGKNTIQYFDAPILNEFLVNVAIENKIKDAIFNQNFHMNYQPQYDAKTKRLRGVEALIRWRESDGKQISPSVFIPIAEKNGTIVPIGNWVMEESIKTHMEWKKKFGYDMILSINISSIQYKRSDFVQKVMAMLNRYDMNPEELELEITESVLIEDFSTVINKMNELRDFGVRVSLDDFGTGFSSLSYLKGLPIDTLKIDKSFIDAITTDEASRIITESIVTMSDRLGFETVAEGVEQEEQLDYLCGISCDYIQGFLLGKPMDNDAMEELLLRLI